MPSIKTQDLYRVVITEAAGIAASGDVDFTVSVAPTRTNGFLVLSPENAVSREVVYFHNVIGNRIYVRGVNRRNPKLHTANDSVQMNDVEDIFNYYSDMVSPLFYMEKTGTLNVRVWGGTVLINRTQVTVADTNLTLTDNATNYIVYDYLTNVVSVNTTGVGLVKVTVTVTSGVIGTPTYNVIKESYADPFVPDTSLVAPVIQNNQFAYADSTGSANAYEVSYTPAPTAYVAGQKFFFKANFQNTGAATINVNGLGAKSIKKLDGATDLASTDISSGAMVEIMYDGTNFQLTSIPQTIKNNDVTQLTSLNLLTDKVAPKRSDKTIIADSEASFVNKDITLGSIESVMSYFGDASDGDVTISGTVTLTRDMFYNNLTLSDGCILKPNGYKFYVNGTLSRPGTGYIDVSGGNGGNGPDGGNYSTDSVPAGTLGVAAYTTGTLPIPLSGRPGDSNTSTANNNGVSTSRGLVYVTGAAGGASGDSTASGSFVAGRASAPGGTHTQSSNKLSSLYHILNLLDITTTVQFCELAPSSSGGESSTTPFCGLGGGSGANGGCIWGAIRNINIAGATAVFRSKGGNAGNGGNGGFFSSNTRGGGGGGGSGGQGGIVILIVGYTNVTLTSFIDVSGGTLGTGGTASTYNTGIAATNGTNGNNGVAGRSVIYVLSS